MSAKVLRLFIAFTLVVGLVPAIAFADPADQDNSAAGGGSQASNVAASSTEAGTSTETVASMYSYAPETIDRSDESGASYWGFDTDFIDSTDGDLAAGDPLADWVGVVPGELAMALVTTSDTGGSLYFSDIESHNAQATGSERRTDMNYGAKKPASVAADVDGDNVDDVVRFYYEEGDTKHGVLDITLTNGVLDTDEDKTDYNRIKIENVYSPMFVSANYSEGASNTLMHDYNTNHIVAADLDGNGCDDIVRFYYGENAPTVEIFYLYPVDADFDTPYFGAVASLFDNWSEGDMAIYGWEIAPRVMLFKHRTVELDLRMSQSTYNGYLPASLETADLNGDGMPEVYVAYQEGDPTSDGTNYCTTLATIDFSNKTNQTFTYQTSAGSQKHEETVWIPTASVSYAQLNTISGNPCTQMTSLSAGDVDGDGYEELVVGGYAGPSAVKGELYLAYMERTGDKLDTTLRGFTWMTDDNGLHKTTGSDLTGQADADTTLLVDDPTEKCFTSPDTGKAYTLTRYVNAANWTVPLACASLTGYQNGKTLDQVFFGSFFYEFDTGTGQFALHRNTLNNGFSGNDDNNIQILLAEATTPEDYAPGCTDDNSMLSVADSGGKEILYVIALLDKTKGDARLDHYVYYDEGSSTYRSTYTQISEVDWDDETFSCAPVIGNFQPHKNQDQDAFFTKLVGHEFMYSEPVVQSVIIAPPSFEDISLASGYDSGSTSLTSVSGTTVDYSASLSVGFDFSILAGFEIGKNSTKLGVTPGFAVAPAYKGSQSQDTQFTVQVSKGQDSVVLTCVPTDLYYYDVVRAGNSKQVDRVIVQAPGEPAVQTISMEQYAEMVDGYNELVDAYNVKWSADNPSATRELSEKLNVPLQGSTLELLANLPDPSELASHTKGRPDTYHQPDGLDTSGFAASETSISLDYGNDFGTTTKSLLVSWKKSDGGGATVTGKAGLKFDQGTRFTDFSMAAGFSVSGSGNKSTSEGTSYKGDLKSVPSTWDDYGMTLTMYAGKLSYGTEGMNDSQYTVVGYDATGVRYGEALPRSLEVTETTSDSVTLSCGLPWGAHNAGSTYVLERLNVYTNEWEAIHTFKKPNVTSETPDTVTETFVDKGGADGMGTDEQLEPNTAYCYRLTDSTGTHSISAQAQTEKKTITTYTVSYSELATTFDDGASDDATKAWGYVMASMVDGTTGWKSSLTNGATILEGSQLRFFAIPFDGYEVTGWKVTEGGHEITGDRTRVLTFNSEQALVVSDVQGDITVEVTGKAIETEDADDDADVPSWTRDNLSTRWGLTVHGLEGEQIAEGLRPPQDKNDTTVDDPEWTSASTLEMKLDLSQVDTSGITAIDICYLVEDEADDGQDGADEGSSTTVERQRIDLSDVDDDSLSVALKGLPDGAHILLATAYTENATFDMLSARVYKDTQEPKAYLACVDSPEKNGSRFILGWVDVGPSDVTKIEIASGKDASDGFEDTGYTVGQGLAKHSFLIKTFDNARLENGWYTLRVTNGAGVSTLKSFEVTGVTTPTSDDPLPDTVDPDIIPNIDPDEPAEPDTPDESDTPGGSGGSDTPSTPGSTDGSSTSGTETSSTDNASGTGDEAGNDATQGTSAKTGDSLGVAFAVAVVAGCLALGAIVLLAVMRARRRRL